MSKRSLPSSSAPGNSAEGFETRGIVIRVAILIAIFLMASILLDVAFAEENRTPVRSLLEIRYQHVVPQKWDISCGAAALATVLNYQHGDNVTEREVAKAMLKGNDPARVKARLGFSLLDMKKYAESRGYRGVGYSQLQMEDLLGMGPTVVPIRVHNYNHFVIFRGVQNGRVLLADPAFGNRSMTVADFQQAWLNNLGFVVKRPDGSTPAGVLDVAKQDGGSGARHITQSAL